MAGTIFAHGRAEVLVPAGGSIAVYTEGKARVSRKTAYANYPTTVSDLGDVSGAQAVFGPYAAGATIVIEASSSKVEFSVGVSPATKSTVKTQAQAAPGTLNATGALTAALMVGGIVTSTTAAAVVATVPTGTVMDAAIDMAINDAFDWSVINTGISAFTVTAATGHTLVGAAAVATLTSGRFRTRKTAVGTFVTYRL